MKVFLVLILSLSTTWANQAPKKQPLTVEGIQLRKDLMEQFAKKVKSNKELLELKQNAIALKMNAVPVLIEVMKDKRFPEKNRWLATFLVGKIMGKKSSAFIAKFVSHPDWIMRLASLKTLLALNQNQYLGVYGKALQDPSLIVRHQALENIRQMKITKLAPHVWGMLYNKRNYSGKDSQLKRTHILKTAIATIGELGFEKAAPPMLQMVQMKKYQDLFDELDESLEKITGKKSPSGTLTVKRHFWKREHLAQSTI